MSVDLCMRFGHKSSGFGWDRCRWHHHPVVLCLSAAAGHCSALGWHLVFQKSPVAVHFPEDIYVESEAKIKKYKVPLDCLELCGNLMQTRQKIIINKIKIN